MSFTFKQFHIDDSHCGMKISTDGVLLGAWVDVAGVNKAIDAGCGSGLITLMIAQRSPLCSITAVDIDHNAITDAARNFACSPWSANLDVIQGDYSSLTLPRVDLIVSNPPFFTTGMTSPDIGRATARHTDTLHYTSLIDSADRLLSADGRLSMILPAENESDVIYTAELARLKLARLCRVTTTDCKPPRRILIEFSRHDCHPSISALTLRNPDGSWTDAYINLTRNFYLNL